MIFGDKYYILFITIVVFVFYALVPRLRPAFLLAVSYVFYSCFNLAHLLVLLVVSAVAYWGGLAVAGANNQDRGRYFTLSLILAMSPLIFFKYFKFLAASLLAPLGVVLPEPLTTLPLPIGISFFTFQAVAYLADIHIGILPAERSRLRVGLFLAFFPIVIAGPIERGSHLLKQLTFSHPFSGRDFLSGLQSILIGLVLKLAVADTLAGPAGEAYANTARMNGLDLLLGTIFFAFQVYADIAGYSLIAIGSARMLGVGLTPNFRQPYLSANIQEFWRTWHISVATWLRDYLYTPLAHHWRRWGWRGRTLALLTTFFLAGLWHGAAWTFVCFGVMHGIYMSVSSLTLAARDRFWGRVGVPRLAVIMFRVPTTFLMVVASFVLFLSASLKEAFFVFGKIASTNVLFQLGRVLSNPTPGMPFSFNMSVTSVHWYCVAGLIAWDLAERNGVKLQRMPVIVQAVLYGAGIVTIALAWSGNNVAQSFVYNRF